MISYRVAFIVKVEDDAIIRGIPDMIQGIDLNYAQLGMTDGGMYVGVIYDSHSPGDGEIDDLLTQAGIKLKDWND